MQKVTITADNLTDKRKYNTDVTLSDWLLSLPGDLLARVEIDEYTYVYYEEYDFGYVYFDENSQVILEIPISNLLQNGAIQYETMLTPAFGLDADSPEDEVGGTHVSITVSDPVKVNYQWVGDVPTDAALPESTYITMGTDLLPATPQVDDPRYRFDGWYYDEACTEPYVEGTVSISDTPILYGHWTKLCMVRYYEALAHSSSEAVNEVLTVDKNTEISTYTPELAGYTFAGWYTDTDLSTAFKDGTAITEDTDLYAKWEPNADTKYTVNYYKQNADEKGYTLAGTDDLTGTTDADIAAITQTYEGYTKSTVTYESSETKAQTSPLTIQGDGSLVVKVYYDISEYTVSYDTNGGASSTEDYSAQTVKHGTVVTVKAAPTKTGYTFSGWKLGDNTYAAGASMEVTADVTLIAQWTPITYTVQFDANTTDATGEMADQSFTYNQDGALTKNAYTRTGYTFTGWNTKADGTGSPYADQAEVSNLTTENGGTVTLYAQWTPVPKPVTPSSAAYQVEHYKQKVDGTYELADTDYPLYGQLNTEVSAEAKDYAHYHVSTSNSNTVLKGTVFTPALGEDKKSVNLLTLKVYYDLDTCTVTYEPNNGAASTTTTVKYGETETLAEAPEKAGYTFAGWKLGDNTYAAGASMEVTADVTLIAQWTPNTYTVQFDANATDGLAKWRSEAHL
jgi:uncharacterized repeat protein (TIGR02543 family)